MKNFLKNLIFEENSSTEQPTLQSVEKSSSRETQNINNTSIINEISPVLSESEDLKDYCGDIEVVLHEKLESLNVYKLFVKQLEALQSTLPDETQRFKVAFASLQVMLPTKVEELLTQITQYSECFNIFSEKFDNSYKEKFHTYVDLLKEEQNKNTSLIEEYVKKIEELKAQNLELEVKIKANYSRLVSTSQAFEVLINSKKSETENFVNKIKAYLN